MLDLWIISSCNVQVSINLSKKGAVKENLFVSKLRYKNLLDVASRILVKDLIIICDVHSTDVLVGDFLRSVQVWCCEIKHDSMRIRSSR